MIKFVIVNKHEKEVEHIVKILDEEVYEKKEINIYSKLDYKLHKELKDLSIHKLYILDIELDSQSGGIDVAKMIRKIDHHSEIIFITKHDNMFETVHRNIRKVFDFIENYYDFDIRFRKDIRDIMKKISLNNMFCYESISGELQIFYDAILYIFRDKKDRKLVIVTNSNKHKIQSSIKDILGYLDERFEQCHRSCILNNRRVEEKNYKEGYFLLDNGAKVDMLSKKYKKSKELIK